MTHLKPIKNYQTTGVNIARNKGITLKRNKRVKMLRNLQLVETVKKKSSFFLNNNQELFTH